MRSRTGRPPRSSGGRPGLGLLGPSCQASNYQLSRSKFSIIIARQSTGTRGSGKTTLVRKLAEAGRTYATLDDPTVLAVGDQEGCGRGLQAGPLPADGFCQGGDPTCITAVLTRDLRDIAAIEKLTELPKFVRLLAEHSGQLVNYQQLGGSIPVSHKTSQRYVALLEQVCLGVFTLVDDNGKAVGVLNRPGAVLEVRKEDGDVRRLVNCTVCTPATEGWVRMADIQLTKPPGSP